MNNVNFFSDLDHVPQPKDKIQIEDVKATPYPDRFRIFIEVKVTPFQERPNLILTLQDEDDIIVGELNIIQTMHHDMEFTMHLRDRENPAGVYSLTAELFYETKDPPQDMKVIGFLIPEVDVQS
jgi:hypothetical protein